MAYRWGQQGPAFEFPTPYAIENRFLRLRAYGLIAAAVLVAVVLAVLQGSASDADSATLIVSGDPAEAGPGSPVPHLLSALLLLVLGVLDWVRASGQRALLLVPGEPASLVAEVRREAAGSSAGVPWLMQALQTGQPATQPDSGVYSGLLNGLSVHVAGAPLALRDHLRVRLGNLLLASGLLVLLLALLLAQLLAQLLLLPLLSPPPGAVAASAGVLVVLGCALMAGSRLGADQTALPPGRLIGLLLLAVLASGGLWYLAGHVPAVATQMAKLDRLALPLAAGVVLVGAWCIELLALLAGRQQLALTASGRAQAAPAAAANTPAAAPLLQADPQLVMQEIDRELHRRWTEGIPNRRHAWQPPQTDTTSDAPTDGSRFTALVLEESQPMVPPGARVLDWAACRKEQPLRTLVLLDAVGLLLTVAACLGWLLLAWTHSHSIAAPWTWGVSGLMALLLGGHALRVAHLLWSRQDAQSTITVLEMDGGYRRSSAAASASPSIAAAASPSGGKADRSTAFDPWRLQARVWQARSVFYAAGRHGDGSRALLRVLPDMPAAAAWVQQMQAYARALPVVAGLDGRAAASASAPSAAASAAALAPSPSPSPKLSTAPAAAPVPTPAPARPRMADVEQAAAARAPARFCPSCGTPLLQGARFCQQCGHQLPTG